MSDEYQLPFLPVGWMQTTLGSICFEPEYGWTTSAEKEGSLKFLRTTDISKGTINWETVPFCKTNPENLDRFMLRPGDIVISRAGSIGLSALIHECPLAVFASYLIRFRPVIAPTARFLASFLKSPDYWRQVESSAVGIALQNINAKKLSAIKLPLAPLAEQQRIVDEIEKQFSRLDAAVQILQRVERDLGRLYASTLKAAVEGRLMPTEAELARTEGRDYESADVLLERILQERRATWESDQIAKMKEQGKVVKDDKWKDKYSDPVRPEFDDQPATPEGWVVATLEQITSAVRSIRYGILMPKENVGEGVLYVKVKDMKGDKIDLASLHRTTPEIAASYSRASLKAGDLLLAIRGTYGRVAEVPPELEGGNITQDTARLAVSEQMNAQYVALFLRSLGAQNYFKRVARGVAVKGVNIADVRLTPVFVPPHAEQKRIVDEVDRRISVIDELKALVTNALRRGSVARKKILLEAFAGDLVSQDPNDEPAEKLLQRIRFEKADRQRAPSRRAPTKTSRKKTQPEKQAHPETPGSLTKAGSKMENKESVKIRDMKLIHLKVDGEYKALLDFDQTFRVEGETRSGLSPICLVGLNGSGKSNLIEALSEIFCYLELINLPYEGITQKARHKELDFEIEYELPAKGSRTVRLIRISKQGNQQPIFVERVGEEEKEISSQVAQLGLLPTWIIGYSSGLNETISIPYFKTKAFYSEDVRNRAYNISKRHQRVETFIDSRTLFMDYDSNAAILIANYIFGSRGHLDLFKEKIRIADVASFDISIRLKYGGNRPVRLTAELEDYIQKLKECASEKSESTDKQSTLNYQIDSDTRRKFRDRFGSAKEFFIALYKLSLLNALALKGEDRKFYLRPEAKEGLLERPPSVSKSDKIFDIDRLKLKLTEPPKVIDYAGISDGEHQFIHIFGTIKLFNDPGTLFIFDEPETHFNPRWRREFADLLNGIPSSQQQEFIISTHSPYVVSGCRKENVFKFERKGDRALVRPVNFETYGSSFEYLLTKLFDLDSLISKQPFEEMRDVIKGKKLKELEAAVNDFGESFEKRFLFEEIARFKKRG